MHRASRAHSERKKRRPSHVHSLAPTLVRPVWIGIFLKAAFLMHFLMEFKLSSDAPARGARPTRRRGASERESGARGATDGTNETKPKLKRRAARKRGRGFTDNALRADPPRRSTARFARGVRPRACSWCAPYPPVRGLGARERRARGDGRDERNDAKPPTKSGALTRPRTHRERVARGLPAPAERTRRTPYPPARGLGAKERRAREDGRNERNDAKPPTKSSA